MLFSVIASQASAASGARSSRQRDERRERHRAAGHVGVHVEHRAMRLQIHAAGIEENALADEGDVGRGRRVATPRRPVSADARCRRSRLGIAAGHGEECAGAGALAARASSSHVKRRPCWRARSRDRALVAARIEHVGWQRGEPARQVGAARDGCRVACIAALVPAQHDDLFACGARHAAGARKLGSAKRVRKSWRRAVLRARPASGGAVPAERRQRPIACGLRAAASFTMRPARLRRSNALGLGLDIARARLSVLAGVAEGPSSARVPARAGVRACSSCQRSLSGSCRQSASAAIGSARMTSRTSSSSALRAGVPALDGGCAGAGGSSDRCGGARARHSGLQLA